MRFSDDVEIIENTQDARQKYHNDFWGSHDIEITKEHLDALIKGKALIWNDGEYSHSICLSKECFEEG